MRPQYVFTAWWNLSRLNCAVKKQRKSTWWFHLELVHKICFCHSKWQKSCSLLYSILSVCFLLCFSHLLPGIPTVSTYWQQIWTAVEWPWPTSFKQKQQFEFRKHTPQINFSCTNALTIKRNASFTRMLVFSRIKVHYYHFPVLRNPDPLHSFIVEDTSEVGHFFLCNCNLHKSTSLLCPVILGLIVSGF